MLKIVYMAFMDANFCGPHLLILCTYEIKPSDNIHASCEDKL